MTPRWKLEDVGLFCLKDSVPEAQAKLDAANRFQLIRAAVSAEESLLCKLTSHGFSKRPGKVALFRNNLARLLASKNDILLPLLYNRTENTVEKLILGLSGLTQSHRLTLQEYGMVEFFRMWFHQRPTFTIPIDGMRRFITLFDDALEADVNDRRESLRTLLSTSRAYQVYEAGKEMRKPSQKKRQGTAEPTLSEEGPPRKKARVDETASTATEASSTPSHFLELPVLISKPVPPEPLTTDSGNGPLSGSWILQNPLVCNVTEGLHAMAYAVEWLEQRPGNSVQQTGRVTAFVPDGAGDVTVHARIRRDFGLEVIRTMKFRDSEWEQLSL
ncbi:hypothetical protein B0T11DRAFT_273661 [Plectosphaerella cucumerina]|uniref:Uncharacterized protein n=1 Tax=Plectosphaerella cucumerina TaxID=40658 RepID=A0A8K0TWK5_9PEZI|nr:hypothetical protein B0T11DRAFT_273661 [Plectosphaerella cucumerina]